MKREEMTIEFKETQREFSFRLYTMPLLTSEVFQFGMIKTYVQRVPGGWIFLTNEIPVFVPWNNEFRNMVRTDII